LTWRRYKVLADVAVRGICNTNAGENQEVVDNARMAAKLVAQEEHGPRDFEQRNQRHLEQLADQVPELRSVGWGGCMMVVL
jgi:hypothetical protein